ncbi:hypothetical protein LPJ66_006496, partial [Kickxella alabastrina]
GVFYAKWKCQDQSGSSPSMPVVNQEVRWAHAVQKTVDIPISKDGMLMPCELKVSIKQEVYSHVRTKVGALAVNLSEYARLSGSSRRYFLQECKLNCTLKLSIHVTQESGPENYEIPPLDRSMVLTDLNDMITNESNAARSGKENSTKGTSFSSRQHSIIRQNSGNGLVAANSTSSVHTTSRSNTTDTSQSCALLPIDNTNVRDLAPFQRSSKKNQQIVEDVFVSSPTLPT